jgi:hypothetical protein
MKLITKNLRHFLAPAILLAAQTAYADYALDASTMSPGATTGENLVVKEGCLDPTTTSCAEKYRWLTSVSEIKIGNLQVNGTLSGDYEVVVTADFGGDPKAIKLLTADNKGITFSTNGDRSGHSFYPNGIGEGGGYTSFGLGGWNSSYNFNEVKIAVQSGVAKVYVNGSVFQTITFDAGEVFSQVAIEGITTNDRVSDVKVRGIQSASSQNPAPDYLADATDMSASTTLNENLVVMEGCLDTSKTSCATKYRWLTSISPIKIANLQVLGQLNGNYEVIVTADFGGDPKAIKLLTQDNKGITFSTNGDRSGHSFYPNGIGEGGGYTSFGLGGWNSSYNFNEVKITVRSGPSLSIAKVYVNGSPFQTITFDPAEVFERVAIEGITVNDRISDVKIRGISSVSSGDTGGGFTQADLDAAYQRGLAAGGGGVAATLSTNLSLHIPSLLYTDLAGGSLNLWADLQFAPGADGSLMWKLSNYGLNQ